MVLVGFRHFSHRLCHECVNQMNVTINVVAYKWKVLKNNEIPLVLRITKDRKRRYFSLGISVKPEYWDFVKNQPKANCPNKEEIQQIITEKIRLYQEQVLDYKMHDKDFTAKSLIEKVNKPVKLKTVESLFNAQISNLQNGNRTGYAMTFKRLKSSLIDFNKHLDIYFSDIDVSFLKNYEAWLRGKGLKENSIGIRIRTLRVLYNIAIEENIVKAEHYPFGSFKVARLCQKTAKRAISKKNIQKVINYQGKTDYEKLAIDLFAFSYLTAGINFVDMAYLTQKNIIENRLTYVRKKTKKVITVPLHKEATAILEKNKQNNCPYLFPILSPFHKTTQQKDNRVHKVIGKVNKCLKEIGKELKLPIDLTTYVARHSFATVLKRSGVSTSIISESLGHSSERITQVYLDSFENSQIDAAMKMLL